MRRQAPIWLERADMPVPARGAAVLVLSLDDVGQDVLPVVPTDADRADLGRRTGIEARRFLARRMILRHAIARRLGVAAEEVRIRYAEGGRPSVVEPAPGLFCSVAARGARVALALSDAPVGVDLEPVEPGPIAWAVLTLAERADIEALPTDDRVAAFLRRWTVKEAYLKALGLGLMRDPARIEIAIDGSGTMIVDGPAPVPQAIVTQRIVPMGGQPCQVALVELPA